MLSEAGFRVQGVAVDLGEALQFVAAEGVDLFADTGLRGKVDGIDAARTLRRRCEAEVIFITARDDTETKGPADELNPVGYVAKPFGIAELTTALAAASCRLAKRCFGG